MRSVDTISPNRIGKSTYRPQIVKTRKNTGLDNPPGDTFAAGYAIGGDSVVSHCADLHELLPKSPSEGGIVQNVPSEARVAVMEPLKRGYSRISDYFAENTGRQNKSGNQSQDNCMLMRCSQHVIPSSNRLDFSTNRKLNMNTRKKTHPN